MKKITLILLLAIFFASCSSNSSTNDSNNDENSDQNHKTEEVENTTIDLLSESDLEGLTANDLRIKRNEIFAKHGYKFKSEDLQKHFSQFDWYSPKHNDVTDMLTETDKKNIELIQKYEAKIKENNTEVTSDFKSFVGLFEPLGDSFEISPNNLKDYNTKSISAEDAEKYLQANIVRNTDMDCDNFYYTAVGSFKFPGSTITGLIVHESVCPMPAVYDEFMVYVFGENGSLIDHQTIAYARGGLGDSEFATAVFQNMAFTQTVEKEVFVEGQDGVESEITIEKYKMEFDLDAKITTTKITTTKGKK